MGVLKVRSVFLAYDNQLQESFEAVYRNDVAQYREFDNKRWPRNRYEVVLRTTPPAKRLLDIGCGDGLLLYNLRSRAKELYGIDLARNRTVVAKQGLESRGVAATISDGNIEKGLDFPDHYFDVVVCADVLQFIVDLWSAMTEFSRLLAPGGHLIITIPNIASVRRRLQLLIGKFPATSAPDEGFTVRPGALYDEGTLHYFTFSILEKLYRRFDILPVRRVGFGRLGRPRNWWPPLLSDGICLVGVKQIN